jgi:bifunctional enzyme CysN/CysC
MDASPLDDGRLRFLTCGSVDDGKSTLIGRMLHDAGVIPDDQLATLAAESRRRGNGDTDFSLLVDGLEAERSQGITIDVAYRFFATAHRRFMVADTPGHEQYTRNMATGAANAELAVLLVDARHGVMRQTRRHAVVASLMGIRHVVLAVNKMDLVGFDEAAFAAIRHRFAQAAEGLNFLDITAIPVCARFGDNVAVPSSRMPWYRGPSLLAHLETVQVQRREAADFRMPVQWVNRTDPAARGYAGTVATGSIRTGDRIRVYSGAVPAGHAHDIAAIHGPDGATDYAAAGDTVTLVLRDQTDISRGDVIAAGAPPDVTDRFDADLIWLADAKLFPGRFHLLKLGTATVPGSITRIAWRTDMDSFERVGAETLGMNDIARVTVALGAPVVLAPFAAGSDLGGFILIDRLTNATVAVGTIVTATAQGGGAVWQDMVVNKRARAAAKGQRPAVLWFTGLSGAGKSTIANLVEQRLHARGCHTAMLDGDNLRHGLNRDLGFSEADRIENIRRAGEAARLLVDAGLIVLASFISPYRADREAARALFDPGEFIEVFVDTPLDECRRRDPKGLYRRVDAGAIRNFTGVDAPYEAPDAAELRLETATDSAERLAERVVAYLLKRLVINQDTQ